MFDFFTQPDPEFGRISWTMGLVWFAALVASVYVLARWQETNAIRRRFWRQVAIGTLVLGGLGIVALVLNALQIPPFNIRAWMYLLAVVTLAFWGWAAYYATQRLPKLTAAAARTSGRQARAGARSTPQVRVYNQPDDSAGERPARAPRPVATTSRRESRRERKRRNR
jgi:hypothetical protein